MAGRGVLRPRPDAAARGERAGHHRGAAGGRARVRPAHPRRGLIYKVFDVVGETLPAMLLTRQAARVANGWNRDAVRAVGERAAERLIERRPALRPGAHRPAPRGGTEGGHRHDVAVRPGEAAGRRARRRRRDRHPLRRAGRRATTAPSTACSSGVPGKLEAVRIWAKDHGVDVAGSWAYSDSVYDLPLLCAVRHPVAVNPDPRLAIVSAVRRWPQQFLDVPAGVPKVVGIEPQRVIQAFARPQMFPWVRFDIDGLDRIPSTGPAILVANHRSYFDGAGGRATPRHRSGGPCASSARRRSSTRRSSVSWPRRSAASGSSGGPGRTSRSPRRPRPSTAASSWRSCRRARSPGAGRSSNRCWSVGGARPGWPP